MPIDSRSRVEDILNVILGNLDPSVLQPPQSRVEDLLQKLNEMISDFDGKIPVHICTSDEYDHETLMPTIEDPDEDTFYLVPAEDSGDDMYLEWIFTEGNRWERFGSGGGTVTIEQSDWNQNDSTQADFIKNKPDLTLKLDKNQGVANHGRVMTVNSSGVVVPTKFEGGNITVTEELVSGEDYELGIEGDGTGGVSDVKVGGATVVNQGVANIPLAGTNSIGAVKIAADYGLVNDNELGLKTDPALSGTIKTGLNANKPIVPSTQHGAAFYGLAKAAGDISQASSSNAIGNYTDNAKDAIQQMIGIDSMIAQHEGAQAAHAYSIGETFTFNGKLYKATSAIAVGDAIVSGINCELTSVSEDVAGLKSQIIKEFVTPEMFGALADYIHDDTQAIQNAIDSGKSVLFGARKEYLITAPLTITTNKITIIGNNARIHFSGKAINGYIIINANDIYVMNLEVHGEAQYKENNKGIVISKNNNSVFEKIYVYNAEYGFYAADTSPMYYDTFIACHTPGCKNGFYLPHGSAGQKNNITFLQCGASYMQLAQSGIGFFVGGTSINLYGCSLEAEYIGIQIDTSHANGISIVGSYFEQNTNCDINIPYAPTITNIFIGLQYSEGGLTVHNAFTTDKKVYNIYDHYDKKHAFTHVWSHGNEGEALAKLNGLSLPCKIKTGNATAATRYLYAGIVVDGEIIRLGSMTNIVYQITDITNNVVSFSGTLDFRARYILGVNNSNPFYLNMSDGATGVRLACDSTVPKYQPKFGTWDIGTTGSVELTSEEISKWDIGVGDYIAFLSSDYEARKDISTAGEYTFNKPATLSSYDDIVVSTAENIQSQNDMIILGDTQIS